jgi:tRNA (cytidine/uridine-2'-O-)-methyltransferase
LQEHDSYQKFYKSLKSPFQIFYITKFGKQNPSDFKYQFKQNTYFVFGKESSGLPRKILDQNENHTIRIPSSNNVRSLNLSNCVAIMSYEYTRQTKFESLNKK